MNKFFLSLPLLLLIACSNSDTSADSSQKKTSVHFYAPAAGTIVAADSIPVTEDELNDFYYSIYITATSHSKEGKYMLDVSFGQYKARDELVYPELTREIVPAVRIDNSMPYSYIIGFYFKGEQKFNDYARVSAAPSGPTTRQIEMKYIKSYYVDSVKTK